MGGAISGKKLAPSRRESHGDGVESASERNEHQKEDNLRERVVHGKVSSVRRVDIPIVDVVGIIAAAFAFAIGAGGIEVVAVRIVNAGATVDVIISPGVLRDFWRIKIGSAPSFEGIIGWISDQDLEPLCGCGKAAAIV